jgi:hypothetical protein
MKRVRALLGSLPLLACLLWASPYAYAANDTVIAVIVSADAQHLNISNLASNELNLIYWRKKQYWVNGQPIHPANLHAEHPLRLQFSQEVLHSLPQAQTNYWNGLYFHGVRPPRSLQSEEAMLRFVSDTHGAIGYIDACHIDERVKPLLWVYHGKITASPPDHVGCQ